MIELAERAGHCAAFHPATGCSPPAGCCMKHGLRGGCESRMSQTISACITRCPGMISPARERPPAACEKDAEEAGPGAGCHPQGGHRHVRGRDQYGHPRRRRSRSTVDITPEEVRHGARATMGPALPNVELAMQEGYSTAPDEVRYLGFGAGMGLPNMKKYTDEMDIETHSGGGNHCAHDRVYPSTGS